MILMVMGAYLKRYGLLAPKVLRLSEDLTQELVAVLTMMVGANVTSSQLVSIAERMLLETDLDQVTCVDIDNLIRTWAQC